MEKMLCGFAQAEITPKPEEIFLDGYGNRVTPAEGVWDPLYVKVFYGENGSDRFVIAVLDVCGFNEELRNCLRNWVLESTGLEPHQFALCATHTHAGPACGVLWGLPINYPYWNWVGAILAKTVQQAKEQAVPCRMGYSLGKELENIYNRRGKEIVDRRVPVCGFYDEQGALRGVITSANCHAVCCTEMSISADYPGVLGREADKKFPGVPFLFLSGHGGDIDPRVENRHLISHEILGAEMAESVFAALEQQKGEEASCRIQSTLENIWIPMHFPAPEELHQRNRELFDILDRKPNDRYAVVELHWNFRVLEAIRSGADAGIWAMIQVARVGALSFVFLPFETLTVTGLAAEEILRENGADANMVIGYANGTNSYLTPAAECGENGYETKVSARWYGLPECIPATEKTVLAAVRRLAEGLFKK